jgi:predicted MFS family arabinose efflux permease
VVVCAIVGFLASLDPAPTPEGAPALAPAAASSEKAIVYLMAGVQFVNVLDFMMVNPLGPQFAQALNVATSKLPMLAGSYTAAACVTGLLGSLFLERFDRRTALVVTLLGLSFGTALGGLATGYTTLLLARVVAGLFGGPATSLAFAIVSDAIPPKRRGWAMGIVMGGFAVASVLGVPAGLLLAHWGGWRVPFFGVALLIAAAAVLASRLLPPLRAHLGSLERSEHPIVALALIVKRPIVANSLLMSAIALMASFVLIPNFPAFMQFNLGYPGERLGLLYLIGGASSLLTTRIFGPLVDRYGSSRVATGATVILTVITWAGFVALFPSLPVLAISTSFFIAMSMRGVAYNTLTSQVPLPHERARFQSVQSAIGHGAMAIAAFLSSRLLDADPSGQLLHFGRVAWTSIALGLTVPFLMLSVERRVRARAATAP